MFGNRVAASLRPRHVGGHCRPQQIVPSLDDAMFRVKNIAAPPSAMRLDK